MSQKDYNTKIAEELIKKENHIRGLAKLLGTNQTTIARKVKELQDKNIIDFKTEGKNKKVFIKKTLEAKNYMYSVESNKLLRILKKYPSLRKIFEQIQNNKKVNLAILFGSYAKETANKESDIDIYVETMDKKLKEEIELIDSKISAKIGEYNKESILIREIEENHVIIKGIEAYYDRNKFFN